MELVKIIDACRRENLSNQNLIEEYQKTLVPKNSKWLLYASYIRDIDLKLAGIENLFKLRELHYNSIKNMHDQIIENKVHTEYDYMGIKCKNSLIRLLSLQGYFATSWAIYDTVISCIGHIIFDDNSANNPIFYPRLPEHIISPIKDKCVISGFRLQSHMQTLYSYPILLSYCLRNCLVHESPYGANDIFESDVMESIRFFELKDSFFSRCMQKYSTPFTDIKRESNQYSGFFKKQFSRRNEQDWDTKDIFTLMGYTEHEIDEACGILLRWTQKSVWEEIKLLFEREIENT